MNGAAVPVDRAARLLTTKSYSIVCTKGLFFFFFGGFLSPKTCNHTLYMHACIPDFQPTLLYCLFSFATEVQLVVSAYPGPEVIPFKSAHTLPGSEVHPN